MSKNWTVGSLIPGKETSILREKAPVHVKESKAVEKIKTAETKAVDSAVKVKQGDTVCSIPVKAGTVLLDAALAQGCSIKFKCRKGTCGACTVDILSGSQFLSKPNAAEIKKLGQTNRRLACQAVIK